MRRKILFRADADKIIGFGHFVRTLALADMLKDDFDCTFYTQTPTDYQKAEVAKVCKLVELPSDDSKFDLFLSLLRGEEIVFLDNYFNTSEYERQVRNKGCKLVVISTNDKHHYADVLINMGNDDLSKFDVEHYTRICKGLEWTILRPVFLTKRQSGDRINGSFVISFGGTDQYGLLEVVVNVLRKLYPQSQLHIIATSLISRKRILGLEEKGCIAHIDVSASEIASLFDICENAILSTSTIAIEALSREINVYAGYYVDNQYKLFSFLHDNRYIYGLGNLLDKTMPEHLESLLLNHAVLQGVNSNMLFATKEKYLTLFKGL